MDLWDSFRTNRKYFTIMADWHNSHGGCAMEDKIRKLIATNIKGNVLDAGCGEGSIMKWFATKFGDAEFYGVDISPIGIGLAKKRCPNNCKFFVGELEKLDFPDDFFNLIYSQSVLEHVRNLDHVLSEFHRVSAKGGKVVIRIGNGGRHNASLYSAFFNYIFMRNKIHYLNPSCELRTGREREDHMSNFDSMEIPSDILLRKLKAKGFRILYFSTVESVRKMQPKTLKQLLGKLVLLLPVFPLNHLGPTTLLLADKK